MQAGMQAGMRRGVQGWRKHPGRGALGLALAGALVAGAVLAAPGAAGAANAPSGTQRRSVVSTLGGAPAVPAALRREARGVRRVEDLERVSAPARRLVTTPTHEVTTYTKAVPRQYGSGAGKVKRGCYVATVTRTRKNALGWTLVRARTQIRNWCHDGRRITSTPTVTRSLKAHWGWGSCGWHDDYAGWLRERTRYGAGGYGRFAYGDTCFAPQVQLRNEMQVQGDGKYFWWN
jgi:hypothetical protein